MTAHSRSGDVARALAAVAVLAVVLLGVPTALAVAVGNPLRGFGQLRAGIDGGYLPDEVLIGILALAVWFLWAEFTAITVVETVAVTRGRLPGRVPLGGMMQPLVGRLVATIALATTLTQAFSANLVARPLPTPVVEPAMVTIADVAPLTPPVKPAVAAADVALPVYTVQPKDDLWSIADRHLGDPFRWREIWALNGGRALPPHGAFFRDDDLIRPGWVLTMPADAVGLDSPLPPVAPTVAPPPPTPTEAQQSATPTGPPTGMADTPTVRPTHGKDQPTSTPGDEVDDEPLLPGTLPLVGLALPMLLAGYAVRRLDLLRRAQLRRRRVGRPLPAARSGEPDIELRLRAIAAVDAVDWIDATTRLLTPALRSLPVDDRPDVIALRAGVYGIEVLLDRPTPPPPGFVSADDDNTWRLDPGATLDELRVEVADEPPATPALATIGGSAEGPVLVNLEHLRALRVHGDTRRVEQFLGGLLLELRTAPWSSDLAVHPAGLQTAGAGVGGDADEPDAPVADVLAGAQRRAAPLGDRAPLSARVDVGGDDWSPTVLVVAAGTPMEDAVTSAQDVGAPIIVHATRDSTHHQFRIEADGTARLEPLGLVVHAAGLDLEVVSGASELLAAAARETDPPTSDSDDPGERVVDLIAAEAAIAADSSPPTEEAEASVEPTVWVRVLGPVEIDGWASPPERPKATEMIVHLASHDRPVGADRLRAALWPEGVNDATFRSAVSRSRRWLGTASNGEDHLRAIEDGRYRLGPSVACDWQDFRRLVARARAAEDSDAAMELFREAIQLVRGEPFAEVLPNTYGWAWAEQLVSAIEVAVSDAAAELGRLAMARGDVATAGWAASRGLAVCPGHEGLFQLRMLAAAEDEDYDAVEQAYRDAVRAARALDPLDEVAPETRLLYEQLRDRRRAAAAGMPSASGVGR
jgi:DNA-binding SARP family transcriptional activator